MMKHAFYCFVALLALSAWAIVGHAATVIPVPNGDFEDWQAIGDGGVTNAGWASVPGGFTPATNVGRNDEMWTNPGSFGSGWQENNKQRADGKYGLQQPANAQHTKVEASEPFSLAAPANGFFIGFANLTEGDGTGESISQVQSGVIGQLQQGEYTLNLAVGSRLNANWEPIEYTISLVTDGLVPGHPGLGTSGGSPLGGLSASHIMDPSAASPSDPEWVDLQLVVPVGAADVGKDFAIRIDTRNAGTNTSFTQANFDNVRLQFVPEPGSMALALVGGIVGGGMAVRRRRRHA